MTHEDGNGALPYPGIAGTAFWNHGDLKYSLLVTVICVLLALVIVGSNGSFLSAGALLAVGLILLLTLYRLDVGFIVLLGMSLIFAQFDVPGFTAFTASISYFKNLKEIPYLPYFDMGVANPFELQFLVLFSVWILLLCIRKDFRARPVALWLPALLWFAWLLGAFAYGMSRGGDFLPALWEARPLMYLVAVYAFVPQVIRTKEQITVLFWVVIVCITYRAFEGIARFADNGWSMGNFETLEVHEDPLLFSTLFFLLLGLVVFGGNVKQRVTLLVLLVPLLLAFYVGKRRAAYASVITAFVSFLVLLPRKDLLRAMRFVVPAMLLLAVYTAVFWNSQGGIAGPIQQIKSGFDTDDGAYVVKDRDYLSNLYRKIENYDLAMTIRHFPVTGIGFGTKYEQPLYLVPLNFALRDYEAHNNVLWLLVKGGALGFSLFWLFLNGVGFRGVVLLTHLKDPYLRAVCALSVVSVVILVAAAFYDLHFVCYRNMIYFGTLLGMVASIQNLSADHPGMLTQPAGTAPQQHRK